MLITKLNQSKNEALFSSKSLYNNLGDYICLENQSSSWLRNKAELPQKGVIIAHMGVPNATVFVPIEWQYSMEKLFAEFASIYYLTWDLSNMSPKESAKEFFRRLEAIATRDRIVSEGELKTVYSTPQPGFFCESMLKLNELVIQAIACPAKIPIHMVNKLHLDVEPEEIQDLKWIWGMEKIRFLDHTTTEMLKLDVLQLKDQLKNAETKAFGAWDSTWLEDCANETLVLRILYQVRPVILDNMAQNSDAYIRQAIDAFENATACPMGTLEELTMIREAVNRRNGPQRGRFGPRFGVRKPFNKPFYEGLNVQAWPMPAQGRRWRRFGPVGAAGAMTNHPVQLNPYNVLNKNKEAEPEVKEEPILSDSNHEVDPIVTVSYKHVAASGTTKY